MHAGVTPSKDVQWLLCPQYHGYKMVGEASSLLFLCGQQWCSYTWAHTGPGPGEFLSALEGDNDS